MKRERDRNEVETLAKRVSARRSAGFAVASAVTGLFAFMFGAALGKFVHDAPSFPWVALPWLGSVLGLGLMSALSMGHARALVREERAAFAEYRAALARLEIDSPGMPPR